MRQVPVDTLEPIQRHFHQLIRDRAAEFGVKRRLTLPQLAPLLAADEPERWFPVPGMYGGFRYWLEGEGQEAKLIAESWCRVAVGSYQRHEITASGSRLVEEGIVTLEANGEGYVMSESRRRSRQRPAVRGR